MSIDSNTIELSFRIEDCTISPFEAVMVACVEGGSAFGFGNAFDGWILRIIEAA